MQYEFHEYANLFPLLSGKEYDRLRDDIKEKGLQQPIVLYGGKVLDGRNRLRVCEELGIEIETIEHSGNDPLGFVLSVNVQRRHLTESQRALLAVEMANMRQGERTDKLSADVRKVSQKEAGEMVGVSERLVGYAKKIIEDGTPKQIESIQKGQKTVSTIIKELNKKKRSESASNEEKAETSTQREEESGKESEEQSFLPETSCQAETSTVENMTVSQFDYDSAEDIVRSWLDSSGRVKRMLDIYEESCSSDEEKRSLYKIIERWLGMRSKV